MTRLLRALACLVMISSLPAPAAATPAELSRQVNLARSGDVATYGTYGFDYSRLQTGAFGNTCVARIEPGVMYAVSDKLFIGAALQSDYSAQSTQTTQQNRYSLGFAPKVSYALDLADGLSAMPQLTVGYRNGWQSSADLLDHAQTSNQMWATFDLPVLIAPTHLGRGAFQPVLQWDFQSSLRLNNSGTLGGGFVLGGRNDAEISCQSTLGIRF